MEIKFNDSVKFKKTNSDDIYMVATNTFCYEGEVNIEFLEKVESK
jgi:hypothetical protein